MQFSIAGSFSVLSHVPENIRVDYAFYNKHIYKVERFQAWSCFS